MGIAERAAARAVEQQAERAAGEVRALVEAGLAVLRRDGADALTVAEVLREAGLSTRAFYRHFQSKDELVLAIYEHDARATQAKLATRLGAARSPRDAIERWVDETLALGFDGRRARRTRPLASEGLRLQAEFPAEFAAILDGVLQPLVDVLRAVPSPDPERDARTIHAITWAMVVERLRGEPITHDDARAHVLRYCLPAIGLRP